MYATLSRFASPEALYRDVDVAARVEGATPHGLIAIMFEELLKSLGTLEMVERTCDHVRRNAAQSRVISLLHGLESALDSDRGGEIAANLKRIYNEARRLVTTAGANRAIALKQARQMLAIVAAAWDEIGHSVNAAKP
jgi:flagellar secretion chaperone FliS